MIIQLDKELKAGQKEAIVEAVASVGYKSREVRTQLGHYLIGLGRNEIDIRGIGHLPGVLDIHRVSDDYKLVSRKWKVDATRISVGDGIVIGEGELALMAGPCSIESEEQVFSTIGHLKNIGVGIMRGGVFKPRSSPYAFRGLGIAGLAMWCMAAREAGIRIITEVMQVSQIDEMYDYVDIFQVGARNTQNFNLLDALGQIDKPVMIKRGISGTIEELLSSAEYVFSGGNERLILCERGIRTYERASRNTLDINAIPILKEKSHLPVVVDPSHGIGLREHVEDVALACVMAGADGIIYETHDKPEQAFSDAQQTLDYSESARMVSRLRKAFAVRKGF